MPERKPIFYDEQRRRWRRTRRFLELAGGFFTIVLIIFILNVIRNPDLPDILRADTHGTLHAIRGRLKPKSVRPGRKHRVAQLGKIPQNYDPLRAAFYVSWDSTSLASLQAHYHDLDLLIPEALHAVSPDGRLDVDQDPKLVNWMQSIKAKGVELPVMSMVNNYDGKDWKVEEMAEMLARPASREKLAKALEAFANSEHEPGIVVDFEEVPQESQENFQHFIHDLAVALALGQPEIDGRPSRGRLELRLQIFCVASRCHNPDELRLSLARFCSRSGRLAGLVCPQHQQHPEARPAAKNRDGHRQLWLRLAGEDEGRSASRGTSRHIPAGRNHRCGIANRH